MWTDRITNNATPIDIELLACDRMQTEIAGRLSESNTRAVIPWTHVDVSTRIEQYLAQVIAAYRSDRFSHVHREHPLVATIAGLARYFTGDACLRRRRFG